MFFGGAEDVVPEPLEESAGEPLVGADPGHRGADARILVEEVAVVSEVSSRASTPAAVRGIPVSTSAAVSSVTNAVVAAGSRPVCSLTSRFTGGRGRRRSAPVSLRPGIRPPAGAGSA